MIDKLRVVLDKLDGVSQTAGPTGTATLPVEDIVQWRRHIEEALVRSEALEVAAGDAVAAYLLRSPWAAPGPSSSGRKSGAGRKELLNRVREAMAERERVLHTSPTNKLPVRTCCRRGWHSLHGPASREFSLEDGSSWIVS